MEPVLLEFISRDNTKEGMQSVIGNMSVVEKSIQDNTVMIRQLEKVLKEMQTQFAGTTQTIADQTDNIAMMEALKKEIDELKAKLLELEEVKRRGADAPIVHPSVPRAAASQFNGLGFSIQQVARELPSLTMGANMFFLAISNNLPILADNLRMARTEYDALTKAGKTAVPVWKQVLSSIFSWQTAMVAGITLLSMYGKDIIAWGKSFLFGKNAMDEAREARLKLNEVEKDAVSTAVKTTASINASIAAIRTFNGNRKEEKSLIDNLNSKYGNTFGTYQTLSEWYDTLTSKSAKYIEMLFVQQKAESLISEAVNVDAEIKKIEAEGPNEKRPWFGKGGKLDNFITGSTKNQFGSDPAMVAYNDALEEKNTRKEELLKEAEELNLRAIKIENEEFTPNKTTQNKENLIDKISDSELKARQKIEEMKVSIMEKGAAKEKAAARARFDAELLRIDQEERERLEALAKAKKQGLPVSKEQVDAVTSQASQQRKGASEVYVKEFVDIEKEYADKQKKDFDSLVGKYQDYTDQRLSIEKKFNEDIRKIQKERDKAQQEGDTAKVEQTNRAIAQATANKGKELIKLDFNQLKETPEYVRAFENLKETSSDTLSSLLAQLENAKSAAAQVLSPDQLREYTTTIQEIMDELDARNPFQTLADRKAELAEAEQELAKAQQQLIAVQRGEQVVTGVKASKFNKDTGKIESEKTYLTATKAAQDYSRAQDNVARSSARVKKAEKEVNDEMNELFSSIKDVGDSVGGQSGQIINLIGDISGFTMSVMNGIEAVADTSATAISNVEKASVILAIISTAIQIATKIAELFKGEDEEAKRRKYIEQLNGIVDIYDKIIDKQKEGIKFGYGFSAIDSARKAMVELNKQTDVYRKIAYESGNKMMGFTGMDTWATIVKEMGINASGDDLLSSRLLSTLSGKQLTIIRDQYKEFWAKLPEEQQKALQAIIDAGDKGKDVIDKWQEAITGISYDSFYDGFIENLANMDMSAADMANNFGEYLRKSILGAMVAKNFQKEIDSLYQLWVSAADDQSAGGIDITKTESDDIQKKYKELIEAMTAARDNMAKDFGWESTTSQSGKAGDFTTITQDQGTKLEGLFTSVQGHVSNIDDTVKDISMIMGKAIDALSKIVENTAYCKYLEQMAADISELKRDGFKMQ
ncbi:hypothetical protein [Bacteroides neonati]|uniref:hypothetical protein n=1 Tax=Bacteroides neonati TaxID=1347393 RepID=UPI0004B15E44|nr:hypothetical protein [Bacteroides neonati]